MRSVCILGATGSVGASVLKVVRQHPELYRIAGMSGYANTATLVDLAREFSPEVLVCSTAEQATQVAESLPNIKILHGPEALVEMASWPGADTVVAAITGSAGLPALMSAAQQGKRLLLANKESLILAGELLRKAAYKSGAELLPVDSEHGALLQCLPEDCARRCVEAKDREGAPEATGVSRLWLTASGGPLWNQTGKDWSKVTIAEACAHPVWQMGQKISVDSATMVNKGLEIMEAALLFEQPADSIGVLVHPQGLVHAIVEYVDGSQVVSMSNPDMQLPIAQGLAWPQRLPLNTSPIDLAEHGNLEFHAEDPVRFQAPRLAREACKLGQVGMITYSMSNEVAVMAFLKGSLSFNRIVPCIEESLQSADSSCPQSLEAVYAVSEQVQRQAEQWVAQQAL